MNAFLKAVIERRQRMHEEQLAYVAHNEAEARPRNCACCGKALNPNNHSGWCVPCGNRERTRARRAAEKQRAEEKARLQRKARYFERLGKAVP